jgi:hypothetical protein
VTIYYPYLRAKQYDVQAVSTVAGTLATTGRIVPVFEPVKVSSQTLQRRARDFQAVGLATAVVINPRVGELVGNTAAAVQVVVDMRGAGATVLPVLIIDQWTSASEVAAFGAAAQGGDVLYFHRGVASASLGSTLPSLPGGRHIFEEGATSPAVEQGCPVAFRLRHRNSFQAQARNADYPPQSFFTDLHIATTRATLGFAGFGDYTVVGATFRDSAGPALAVAIHITECTGQGVLCNHFVSTTNTTPANPAGKFAEALNVLLSYGNAHPGLIDFSTAYREFLSLGSRQHFPGLGTVKQLCIQHHLELMARHV